MDIGGRKDKNNDKDNRKKDKGKEKEIAEDEMPRNKKNMEDEKKRREKLITVCDDGDDLPSRWDWRDYWGIISNVLEQGTELICWAIAFTRAIEALFNIGQRLEHQRSFSIQHFVNNIQLGTHGLEDCRTLGAFVMKHGILEEGECSYTGSKEECTHVNPSTETIDRFVVIDHVDDVDLARLVMRHPVVGVLPSWNTLARHKQGIYNPRPADFNTLQYHAVLIVGFGVNESGFYWIVQNSWGRTWGEGGFGLIHRESRRGGRSLFFQVYYGEKNAYPQKKKK